MCWERNWYQASWIPWGNWYWSHFDHWVYQCAWRTSTNWSHGSLKWKLAGRYGRHAGFWNFMSRLQFNSGSLRCLDLSNIRLNQQLFVFYFQLVGWNKHIFLQKKGCLKCLFCKNELEKLKLCSVEHILSSKNATVEFRGNGCYVFTVQFSVLTCTKK